MNIITVEEKLDKKQLQDITGKWIDESYIKYPLITDNSTVYDMSGNIILVFLKNIVPFKYAEMAYPFLRRSAVESNNRGMASGDLTAYKVGDKVDSLTIGKIDGNRFWPLKKDGTLSNSPKSKSVNSGVIGYMDRYARIPYCRAVYRS